MEFAKIQVSGTFARVMECKPIPSGLVGGTISVEYTAGIWEGLTKTVVFSGAESRDVITDSDVITIPHEVVAKPNKRLYVGFYGTDTSGNVAIPAFYADLGLIRPGTDPTGDLSTDPAIPVWAQLAEQVADLRDQIGNLSGSGSPGSGSTDFKTDETLKLENGELSVNTTDQVQEDCSLPITSQAVHEQFETIVALLKTV